MSVKELELKLKAVIGGTLTVRTDKADFEFHIFNGEDSYTWLDRSQAHLLMLYLQEHSGNRILSKEEVLKGIDRTLNEVSVFEKEIWNAAIEKAAVVGSEEANLCCDRSDGFKENVAAVIRKLKM